MTASWTPDDGREPRTGELPVITPGSAAPKAEVHTRLHSRGQRLGDRLPPWMGSIRVRLTVVYSTVVFGLASLVVSGIYLGLRYTLENQQVGTVYELPQGQIVVEFNTARIIQNERLRAAPSRPCGSTPSAPCSPSSSSASASGGWSAAGCCGPSARSPARCARSRPPTSPAASTSAAPTTSCKRLADTFDAMLGRVDDAFESQRQFIHEATHELRNPLAVIRTNLEVTLSDPDASADDLRHTAEVVERTTERMTHLVDDLLVYARKGTLSMEREPVDVGRLVAEVAAEFAAPAEAAGQFVEREAPGASGSGRPPGAAPGPGQPARQRRAHRPVGHHHPGRAGREGRGCGWPSRTRARGSPPTTRPGVPALLARRSRREPGPGPQRPRAHHRAPDRRGPRRRGEAGERAGARRGLRALVPGPAGTGTRRARARRPVLRSCEVGDPVSGVPGVLSSRFRVAAVPCAPRSGHRRAPLADSPSHRLTASPPEHRPRSTTAHELGPRAADHPAAVR